MASSVAWGQRKALGRRYGQDPAYLLAQERLAEEYALAPGREARALQESQFARGLALNKEQMSSSREAGIVGTVANLGTTALLLNYMKPTEPWVGKALADWSLSEIGKTKMVNTLTTQTYPATEVTTGMGAGVLGGAEAFNAAQLEAINAGASYETIGALGKSAITPALTDTAALTAEGGLAATEIGASATGASGTVGVTAAPSSLGFGAAAGAGAVGGYIGGQLGQPIGEALDLGGERERGAIGGAALGAGAAWATGAAMGSAAGPVGIVIGAVIGGIVGLISCFLKGTPIDMQDGSVRLIETIDLFDNLKEGGAVNGIGKMISDNIYDYHGVFVSGSHAVLEHGIWKRIEDSDEAIEIPIDDMVVVYAVNNQHHRIISKGITFADYGEVTDSEDMTPEERIAYLNGHKDFEVRGTSLSVPC